MHILVVGLSHLTAPVELRERVAISDYQLDAVLEQFRGTRTLLESVVLSTCNRTEVYTVVSSVRAGEDFLKTFLARRVGVSVTELSPHLFAYQGEEAVSHVMKVATGLDSLVLGETQILGQVRSAYLSANDVGNTGVLLNRLFRLAIHVGKRAQSETTIGQNAVSVSYAAVQLSKKIFGDLSNRNVLVLGAGKMSRLSVQHLAAASPANLYVSNRTFDKADQLAREFGGVAKEFENLREVLESVDVVISSTGATEPVITAEMVESAIRKRGSRPLALIDIAVPRDVAAEVGSMRNVYLYDIDDLQGVVAANLAERERQAVEVGRMIEESCAEFFTWWSEQEVVPLISAVREKGMAIQATVMESLERKLPHLSERDRKLIHKHTMSIVNQILREPILNMKELAIASGGAKHVQVFAQLFGIGEDEFIRGVQPQESLPHAGGTSPTFVELVKQWTDALLGEEEKVMASALHSLTR